ncbi:MAG: hypothetical protein ACFFCE_03500 [Promethearchaeota archaeon]
MCEFKIINKSDNSQIAEEILILSYTDTHELILKDVLGMGEKLDSALILDVNTLNQKCMILQHPLIKDFLDLLFNISSQTVKPTQFDEFIRKVEELKKNLK